MEPQAGEQMPFRFYDLPAELRDQIYACLLRPAANCIIDPVDDAKLSYNYDLRLFRTNKQMYAEARRIFRLKNIFARIESPWDEAQVHCQMEGNVPVIATGEAADTFNHVHLRCIIDAHMHAFSETDSHKFVVFVDDLERFAKMWMFSDLSYAGDLNPNLRLQLLLENPSAPESDEYIKFSPQLQRRLLLPLSALKNLRDVIIRSSDPKATIDPEVEREVRAAMNTPYDSAEVCLEKAEKLKDEGDILAAGDAHADPPVLPNHASAIEKYIASFTAMHIICTKRRRAIWADAWFDRFITRGAFAGSHGQIVRLILRVQLVARVVTSYHQLGVSPSLPPPERKAHLEEAYFWGMRTINLLRDQISPHDVPHASFPDMAREAMGACYYRTGLSAWELTGMVPVGEEGGIETLEPKGDWSMRVEARRLLVASRKWCRGDEEVLRTVSRLVGE